MQFNFVALNLTWKRLQFHPDENNESDAEEIFKEIGEAYETLSQEAIKEPGIKQAVAESTKQTGPRSRNSQPVDGNDPFCEQYCDTKAKAYQHSHKTEKEAQKSTHSNAKKRDQLS